MQIATGPVKGSEETRDRGVGSGAGTEEVQVTLRGGKAFGQVGKGMPSL